MIHLSVRKKTGAGMVLVLVLLAASSLWVEHNLNAIRIDDRITASFRQSQWALTAAEDAALRAGAWWSATDALGQRHDQRFWGDVQASREALDEILTGSHGRLIATIGDLQFDEDVVRFTMHGSVSPAGPVRTLMLVYRRPDSLTLEADAQDAEPALARSSGLIAWFEPRDAGHPLP